MAIPTNEWIDDWKLSKNTGNAHPRMAVSIRRLVRRHSGTPGPGERPLRLIQKYLP
jgi:hypothetical protein